jgi:hypothetical protein
MAAMKRTLSHEIAAFLPGEQNINLRFEQSYTRARRNNARKLFWYFCPARRGLRAIIFFAFLQ